MNKTKQKTGHSGGLAAASKKYLFRATVHSITIIQKRIKDG